MLPENIVEDVQHFVELFSRFHEAMPDENQHVFRQVIKQVEEVKNLPEETYLQGKTGIEPVWTFEKSGVKVNKRVFHPGRGEHETGADFVLSKKTAMNTLGITAIQTKRNRGKSYFEFDQRNLSQLNKFSSCWRSGYYLMVDETVSPPIDCFITIDELKGLIAQSHTALLYEFQTLILENTAEVLMSFMMPSINVDVALNIRKPSWSMCHFAM
jgi:hypothetical protein